MTRKKYGFWDAAGDITAALFAVPTCGASMVLSPTARGLVGNVLGGSGDDNSDTNNKMKQWEIQNEQWKTQMEAQKAELERLRKEREEENNKIKKNNEEINRLRAIINDPNKSEEDKNKARKRLVILEGENRKLKDSLRNLETKIKDKEQPLPAPSAPLGLSLPKFSAYDKMLIAAILVLIIYFLFLREDKKR